MTDKQKIKVIRALIIVQSILVVLVVAYLILARGLPFGGKIAPLLTSPLKNSSIAILPR